MDFFFLVRGRIVNLYTLRSIVRLKCLRTELQRVGDESVVEKALDVQNASSFNEASYQLEVLRIRPKRDIMYTKPRLIPRSVSKFESKTLSTLVDGWFTCTPYIF
jgi:hypothetical protein